jgi:hypothetical protein
LEGVARVGVLVPERWIEKDEMKMVCERIVGLRVAVGKMC